MTYDEAITISERLKAHLNTNDAFSVSEKAEIEALYAAVLDKPFKRTRCQRCYHDALIEVVVYLRKEGKMKEKTAYALRAGFIIHCPSFHNGKIYTNNNLTDEIAAEYLSIFPSKRPMFSKIPDPTPKEAVSLPSDDAKDAEAANTTKTAKRPSNRKKRKK